ncbi:unnamed protein product [Nezara viridula]|uniref:Uncharacterized protein n=1 Tax=Nezara viridula TaxID=85310 RepID=A0A9P0GWD0_NEZVI|nr:unnamed protein product [Nezara viridula]
MNSLIDDRRIRHREIAIKIAKPPLSDEWITRWFVSGLYRFPLGRDQGILAVSDPQVWRCPWQPSLGSTCGARRPFSKLTLPLSRAHLAAPHVRRYIRG